MKSTKYLACAAILAGALLLPAFAAAQDAKELAQKASAAYNAKDFAAAGPLYVAAANAGKAKATNLYNAACSYALAGKADQAFQYLQASIDAGLGGQSPADDPDFASLHADARWSPLVAGFEAAHPELAAIKVLGNGTLSTIHRYSTGRQVIAAGGKVDDTNSLFNQYYANPAQFVGEYDEASKVYGWTGSGDDLVAAGFSYATPAVPVVLAQARGRQAVFLNESHGQAQTRAAIYSLLAGLRKEGFGVLAMETLATTDPVARDATHCSNTTLFDAALPTRGYAVASSGYYSQDPVYAEIVREALRLGFKLVAYDSNVEGGIPGREQNEAENLACVFKDDPKARLVVLAGFSHIAEDKDLGGQGGWMAVRFRQLTGIDPLTVDSTTQLHLSPGALKFTSAKPALSYVLQDAQGTPYHSKSFDLVLYVPAPAHRNDGEVSWLALGGARKPTQITVSECAGHELCFVAARRVGEVPEAVAADACVVTAPATGCTLFLRPGRYDVAAMDAAEKSLAHQDVIAK